MQRCQLIKDFGLSEFDCNVSLTKLFHFIVFLVIANS